MKLTGILYRIAGSLSSYSPFRDGDLYKCSTNGVGAR